MNTYKYMRNKIISRIEEKFKKQSLPNIEVGDSIRIGVLIEEGNKERTQFSEGVVIAKNNSNLNTTITIRKILQNIGVEKVYLVHSPRIKKIEITRKSKIRRAKLFYLRNRSGKATRLKQRFN
uniref:ribosomal protein L19 n=1 Tax=Caulacanthus ustulatus TaxID=31411 RepID=UPI0027DA9431|nr:ribosomal protein L19 [Caulacanthus ustulatus]WCH57399.1 ribosomal protein L19 [Caulacanthus ustulatus]